MLDTSTDSRALLSPAWRWSDNARRSPPTGQPSALPHGSVRGRPLPWRKWSRPGRWQESHSNVPEDLQSLLNLLLDVILEGFLRPWRWRGRGRRRLLVQWRDRGKGGFSGGCKCVPSLDGGGATEVALDSWWTDCSYVPSLNGGGSWCTKTVLHELDNNLWEHSSVITVYSEFVRMILWG